MSGDPDRWRRVEKLCSEALDRSGADRDAFLSAACGSDGSSSGKNTATTSANGVPGNAAAVVGSVTIPKSRIAV